MTPKQIKELAKEAAKDEWETFLEFLPEITKFAKIITNIEREECAKLCEKLVLIHPGRADLTARQCAEAIKARGIK
jgi:hypothetical protein